MEQNPYHAFLIKHRIWCDRCSDLTPAVVVRNYNGHDTVLCSSHAGRLDAVRRSEEKQYMTCHDAGQLCKHEQP